MSPKQNPPTPHQRPLAVPQLPSLHLLQGMIPRPHLPHEVPPNLPPWCTTRGKREGTSPVCIPGRRNVGIVWVNLVKFSLLRKIYFVQFLQCTTCNEYYSACNLYYYSLYNLSTIVLLHSPRLLNWQSMVVHPNTPVQTSSENIVLREYLSGAGGDGSSDSSYSRDHFIQQGKEKQAAPGGGSDWDIFCLAGICPSFSPFFQGATT